MSIDVHIDFPPTRLGFPWGRSNVRGDGDTVSCGQFFVTTKSPGFPYWSAIKWPEIRNHDNHGRKMAISCWPIENSWRMGPLNHWHAKYIQISSTKKGVWICDPSHFAMVSIRASLADIGEKDREGVRCFDITTPGSSQMVCWARITAMDNLNSIDPRRAVPATCWVLNWVDGQCLLWKQAIQEVNSNKQNTGVDPFQGIFNHFGSKNLQVHNWLTFIQHNIQHVLMSCSTTMEVSRDTAGGFSPSPWPGGDPGDPGDPVDLGFWTANRLVWVIKKKMGISNATQFPSQFMGIA